MIVAGAGSGKTRVLTYRVAHLIENGVKPYQILALTFTNKAAKEMKHRIEQLVGEQAVNVWAGTFHSIFARILRHECEAIGFQRNFTIYDSDDSLGLDQKYYVIAQYFCAAIQPERDTIPHQRRQEPPCFAGTV